MLANELSERFDTPVLLRTATRVAHSQSLLETHERRDVPLKPYEKNPAKYVMSPGNAIPRHADVEKRLAELAAYSETAEINRAELRSREIGFVASGVCYQYVREAFPEASVFKIGMSYPSRFRPSPASPRR